MSSIKGFGKRLVGWFSDGRRLPPTIGLVCVVLLASGMGDTDGGYFVGAWAPTALILAALGLLVSAIGFPTSLRSPRWGILALGLLAAYSAWTFASLLWSPDRGSAWLGAGQTLVYLLAFWVAMSLVALGASRRWVLAASVLGPATIAALTLSVLIPRLDVLFQNGRLVGTVGYYNGEAAFLLTSFWVAVYLGGSRRVNPALRGAVLAGAVLSADLAILTQSRGAMVAMALSLPIFFVLSGQRLRGLLALLPMAAAIYAAFPALNGVYLAFLQGENPYAALERALPIVWVTAAGVGLYGLCWGLLDRQWTLPRIVGRVAGGVALVCAAAAFAAGAAVFVERAGDPAELARQKWEAFKANDATGEESSRYLSASGNGRYELWRVAWEDFAAHPVLGVGTQNYEATYYKLREQNVGSVRQPHSLPLEMLSERGAVGGALFLGFLAVCLGVGLRGRFGHLRPEGKAQVGALSAAITYWFVHSSVEWFWQLPAVTLPAFVYLALLVSPWRMPRAAATPSGRAALRAGGALFAVLTVAVVVPLYAADHYLQRSHAVKDPAEALAAVERAQRFDPLSRRLPEREAELAIEIGDWARAERAYERAIRLDPEHYAPPMYRATFHERRGEIEEAIRYYRRASALNPLNGELEGRQRRLQRLAAE